MTYIIDGHNLIPKVPGLSLSAMDDELALVRLLQAFASRRRKRVEVYFDKAPPGRAGRQTFGRVNAHFISEGSSADAAIRARLIALGKAARNWIVVSSDREVQAAARTARAQHLKAEEFARQLMADSPQAPAAANDELSLSQEEVEAWLRLFEEPGEESSG